MKINQLLTEALGNLAQLNLGKFIPLLKYNSNQTNRYNNLFIDKKFDQFNGMSYNSEIIDLGQIKKGLTDIRAGYKANVNKQVVGFVLYLGNKTSMFCKITSENIRGFTKNGVVGWDFSEFVDGSNPNLPATSAYEKNDSKYDYEKKTYETTVTKYAGAVRDVTFLKMAIDTLQTVALEKNLPLTCKLITSDPNIYKRRQERVKNSEANEVYKERIFIKTLFQRLKEYKNAKKPKVDDIEDFIKQVLLKTTATIQFDGIPWKMADSSYEKMDPMRLIRGAKFNVTFVNQNEENSYSKEMTIVFMYDNVTNKICPITARYTDINGQTKKIVINASKELTYQTKIPINSAEDVMKAVLTLYKKHSESPYTLKQELVPMIATIVKKYPELTDELTQLTAMIEKA